MASKKGIALTIGIAAAIIGSSFLIWYLPQTNPGVIIDAPSTDGEIIGDAYSRHNDLATDIDTRFEQWKTDAITIESMMTHLDSAKSQVGEMREQLDAKQTAQEWQQSYELYVQALDAYTPYLDALVSKVNTGEKTNPDPSLNEKWKDLVDQSVEAMPINN